MAKVKPIVAKTPEELARVLGLSLQYAATWEIQHELQSKIVQIVKKNKLTHAALAKLAGTSRTRITSILNNNLEEVSTDLLIRIVKAAGYRVEIQVSKNRVAA